MNSLPKHLVQKYQNWTTYAFMTFCIILLNLIVHNMPPTNSHVIYIEIIRNSITFPSRHLVILLWLLEEFYNKVACWQMNPSISGKARTTTSNGFVINSFALTNIPHSIYKLS